MNDISTCSINKNASVPRGTLAFLFKSTVKNDTMIEYKTISKANKKDIIDLYESVNWTNYTQNPNSLLQGIQNSLCLIGAFKGNRIIGLIRIIGDGCTIIYVQDLLVHPEYQYQGIGQELMRKILNEYVHVRQKVLLTDTSEMLDSFYRKTGFISASSLGLTCYVKLSS